MELVDYHKLRRGVQLSAPHGAAEALGALAERLGAALRDAGFTAVETEVTQDPDRLVIALCTFPAGHPSRHAAEVLEQLWQYHLQYRFWEAHAVLAEGHQVELLAATRASEQGHYATLHVVAQRAPVPAQRPAQPPVAASRASGRPCSVR